MMGGVCETIEGGEEKGLLCYSGKIVLLAGI